MVTYLKCNAKLYLISPHREVSLTLFLNYLITFKWFLVNKKKKMPTQILKKKPFATENYQTPKSSLITLNNKKEFNKFYKSWNGLSRSINLKTVLSSKAFPNLSGLMINLNSNVIHFNCLNWSIKSCSVASI